MIFLQRTTCQSLFVLICLAAGLVQGPTAAAQSLEYTVVETLPFTLPANHFITAIRDMDGDGILDIVHTNFSARRIHVDERDGVGFVNRHTIQEFANFRAGPIVREVDGDGLPEILSTTNVFATARIWESSADNTYVKRATFSGFGILESAKSGDSDGDGRGEFLFAQESFPSRIRAYEAVADNTYSLDLPIMTGDGGDTNLAGVADLDGDGLPETVFSDNSYSASLGRVYVYENRVSVFRDLGAGMLAISLGDMDGNGLGEIIGVGRPTPNMKILESTGVGNGFQVVFDSPPTHFFGATDFDGDGQSEFLRFLDDGAGNTNIFAFGHRSGATITDFFNSGTLMQGFAGDVRSVLSIGDTNGNGVSELAVLQGDQIHILEAAAPGSCLLGQGFWKHHPGDWPVASLTLGAESYSESAAIVVLNTPSRGDASLILAKQLITAKLNVANGSETPAAAANAITSGDAALSAFVGALPYGVSPRTAAGQSMTGAAGILDSYNNGELMLSCRP